jgi:hypothetical protein
MSSMKTLGCGLGVLLMLAAASVAAQRAPNLTVTVSYKGKGPVDEAHDILVFLFDHPEPTASSNPVGLYTVSKNGGTATFTVPREDPVFIVMVYDANGDYDGRSGPPPPGTPIATYSRAGKPVPVTPGPGVKVTASFDDSKRWTP